MPYPRSGNANVLDIYIMISPNWTIITPKIKTNLLYAFLIIYYTFVL